jgi:hypothetical protein
VRKDTQILKKKALEKENLLKKSRWVGGVDEERAKGGKKKRVRKKEGRMDGWR